MHEFGTAFHKIMKSNNVQDPRRKHTAYQANNAGLLATPHGVVVFTLALAASVCLVWGEAEPATLPLRTILHDALNGQTASSNRSYFMPIFLNAPSAP